MPLKIAVEPIEEPLGLDEVKAHLRLDIDDDNGYLMMLITTARQYAETVTGRALYTQSWHYYLDAWPDKDYIEMPLPPLRSVTSVKYTDYNAAVTTWAAANYIVDTYSIPGRVVLAYGITWPTVTLYPSNPIDIYFGAGYGTADDIPEAIKQGMKIDIADMYENRESIVVGQPVAHLDILERIYQPYRVWNF